MRRPEDIQTRRPKVAAVGIFLFFAGLYTLTAAGHLASSDEVAIFQTTRLWATGQPIAPSVSTTRGPDGRWWGLNGPVASVLALPFYGAGAGLERWLPEPWREALAGERVANDAGVQWGGDLHIFTVSFLNVFASAFLVIFFWLCALRLGHGWWESLAAAAALGTTTLVATYSKTLFAHTLEALFLLCALFAILEARRREIGRAWLVAGSMAAFMVLTRSGAWVAAPWLIVFVLLAGDARESSGWAPPRRRAVLLFALPLLAAGLFALSYNRLRFGGWLTSGYEAHETFHTSLWAGLYGHLFSVGRSIFLFSPPLVLACWLFPEFFRRHRSEARIVLGVAVSYLLLYSRWGDWSGGWAFGDRFLLPLVPLLLLTLPLFFERLGRAGSWGQWIATTSFFLGGLAIQTLGLAVNVSKVFVAYHLEPLERAWRPIDAMLFVPQISQVAAHFDAIRHLEFLDFWLLRVSQQLGWQAALLAALPGVGSVLGGGLLIRAASRPQ